MEKRGKRSNAVADAGEKNGVWRREKDGVGAVVWEKRENREKVGAVGRRGRRGIVCGGWRPCTLKNLRSKKIRSKILQVQGVQSMQGICFWGCSAVRHEYLGVHCSKKTVIHSLTMGKDGIKISFGGTGEIIGGAGRSPQETYESSSPA